MKIVVDENVTGAEAAFGTLGDVTLAPGRAIDNAMMKDADAVVVRTVTQINESLLAGTNVRFVGTATIGEDHVDKDYLKRAGIVFTSAPGCNANAVSEYITAAICELADERGFRFENKRLGIVGAGHVGTRVAEKAAALGMDYVLNDPPLADATGDDKYKPIDDIFDCDIITLHVPLTKDGDYPTHHMVDAEFLAKTKRGVVIMNSSRGDVIVGDALRDALESGSVGACVLDVWPNEPNIDTMLLANCAIATPHIAGYSMEGKVNGTRQVYNALCKHIGATPTWTGDDLVPAPRDPITLDTADTQAAIIQAIRTIYPIRNDDTALRPIARQPAADRPAYFDQLRKDYAPRPPFANQPVQLVEASLTPSTRLGKLGFR